MKKLASLLFSFLLSGLLVNAQFSIDQITQFGTTSDQVPSGMSISNGALFIAGNDAGQSMVLKYNSENIETLVWNLKWPLTASSTELFGGVAADASGVYVSGYSYSQTTDGVGGKEHKSIVCKFPSNGATGPGLGGLDWIAKPTFFSYMGYENYMGNLMVNVQDTSYIYSYGMAQTGGTNATALITKHATNGDLKWQSIIGNQSSGIQGYAYAMCQLNNALYIGGCENHWNLWKVDLAGNKIWSKMTEETVPSIMMGICASSNAIYGAGYEVITGRGHEALIIKYDEDGNILWKKVWGGALDDFAYGIEIIDNTLWVVGETSSYGSGGKDGFILKLNALDGSVIDSIFGGGPLDDAALKISKNGQELYVSGTFQGTAKFGSSTLTSMGGKDLFLMKLKSSLPVHEIQGIPATADANSVILDHFDGANMGETVGTVGYIQGVSGLKQAIDLSNWGNYIIYSRTVNMENSGTVEMWVKPKHYARSLLNINWNYTKSYPPAGHVFHMMLDSLGKVGFSTWGYSVSNAFKGKTNIPLNAWTHIAITWGDSTKLYINGKLDMASGLLCRPAIRNQAYFYLPYWGDSTGFIDELHISKIKRSPAEIASRIYTDNPDKVYSVTPGNLANVLSSLEKNNLRSLKLSGGIDARDFRLMRDSMPMLENLDMSGVYIAEYIGTEGPRYGVKDLYPANTIPRNAFVLPTGKTSLKTVVQPANVTEIGRSAYNRCYNLSTINWPAGIAKIGYAAFNDCQNLKEAVLYNGIAELDTFVFRNCIRLTSIVIPSTVKEIRYGAFQQCTELSSPILEANSQLTHIGSFAFTFCPKITSFVLPPKVNFIGSVPFLGTSAEVTVPTVHSYFTNINGVLYDKVLTRLLYCPASKTGQIDIPPTVTNIASDAFYNCMGLDSITIPASVRIIEDWAFENCTGLRSLTIPASVTEIWAYAFYNCSGLNALFVNTAAPVELSSSDSVFNYINKNTCTLYVLSGLKPLYQAADKWKEFTNIVEVSDAQDVTPGNLHTLWSKDVREGMKRLNLAGSIDARDFKTMRDSMPMLEYIDLSAVSIEAYTGTGGPWNATDFTYQANKIPEGSFNKANGNNNLKTFILPSNLEIIGRSAFNRCYNLSSVKFGSSVHTIERYAFVSCGQLNDISLPSSLRTLLYGAFARTGLNDITLPEGVKFIGEYTFQNCSNLETITLPSTVEYIGYCAITFNNRLNSILVAGANPHFSSLDGVLYDKLQKTLVSFPNMKSNYYRVPEGVEAIDTAAFEGCWALKTIELPSTLKKICLEAFYNCDNLMSVEIPTSVTSIEAYAFLGCYNLKTISARQTVPVDISASTSIFEGVDLNACILRVPNGAKYNYQAAATWNTFPNLAEDLSVTVNITAGGLFNALNSLTRSAVTHLKVNGTLDARDFKTMREDLPLLAEVDISGANIAAYNGTEGTRSYFMNHKANAIPADAFFFRDRDLAKRWLTKFVFPTSLTEIGDACFTNTGLRSITLHEGITSIGPWSLYGCRLNTVHLPSTMITLMENCFGSNSDMTAYTVAAGNTRFMERNGLLYDKAGTTLLYYPNAKASNALIPNGTKTIQAHAFEGCDFVFYINISSEVNNIIAQAFRWTSNLTLFQVESANPYYSTIDGVLYDGEQKKLVAYPNKKNNYYDIPSGIEEIGPSAFHGCWNLNEVNIPNSVSKISKGAFQYCDNLNSINIPYSINAIEMEAFAECYNLKRITVNRDNPIYLNNSPDVFRNVDKGACVLRVPQSSYWSYKSAAQWGEFSIIDEVQNVTYRVMVPSGTKSCFIAGEMNGWNQQEMTKDWGNVYNITLNAHQSDTYKYCSGPEWKYEELNLAGNTIDNRNYQNMDTVLTWREVYQPWMPYSPWKIDSKPNVSVGKIQFVSETEGWIASGNNNSLLHTVDGGEIWNTVIPFPDDVTGNFSDPAITMDWISPTHGWALKTHALDPEDFFNSANGAVLYNTKDGGTNWSKFDFQKSKTTMSYSDSDLMGTWQMHEIIEGNYENMDAFFTGWGRAKMTVAEGGSTTFSDQLMSMGNWVPNVEQFHLMPNGTFTMEGTDMSGFLNADKNTGFFTLTNEIGCNIFGVIQKQKPETTYTLTDLQGSWQMHLLGIGNPATQSLNRSEWTIANVTIDDAGNAQMILNNCRGEINNFSTKFFISADGFVTMNGMNWHGYMSADKMAFYSTYTDDGGKAFSMCVMQKKQAEKVYSLDDLEGSWRIHDISLADPNETMNGHHLTNIRMSVHKDGSAQIFGNDTSDDNDDNRFKLSISSSGLVSIESMVFNGYMNAAKNTVVFTSSDDHVYALGVMQKDSSFSGDMGLQVQFADENNGWASTYNPVVPSFQFYRTTNGGTDWNSVAGAGPAGIFEFVDANNGWSISMGSDTTSNPFLAILNTTDGGLTWNRQYTISGNEDDSFNALQFTDLNHGWVTGDNGILLKTVDGGQHWTQVTNSGRTPTSNSKSVFFLDANTGWGTSDHNVDRNMVIFHTNDGGATWSEQNTNLTDGSLFSLYFWNENHGWFTGEVYDQSAGEYHYSGIIGRLNDGAVTIGKQVSTPKLILYPNPVSEAFHLIGAEPGSMLTIHQLNGAVVWRQRMDQDGTVDIRNLKKGMYLVRINSATGVTTKKIVKM